jgi:plasmid stability protein
MATLTLKQVPDELYQRLRERAAAHRRSFNNEAITCLEQALGPREFHRQSWLEEVRALRRQTPKLFLTDEMLRKAEDEGRP